MGDIGGCPIPHVCAKDWQILKYRIQQHLNTEMKIKVLHFLPLFVTTANNCWELLNTGTERNIPE